MFYTLLCNIIINPQSQIDYPKFHRNFYHEHSEIAAMAMEQVKELKRKLGLTVN